MGYTLLFVTCCLLLFLPSTISAQNPEGLLTFENCTIKFFYPQEWKNYVTDYFECKENDQAMNGITEITFPQPSLSEKITPKVTITVEPCCIYASPPDEEGIYHANWKNMTLDEYIEQALTNPREGDFIINHGPITLSYSPAYKIVGGYKTLDPSNPTFVTVYSIDAAKLFTINYHADPSDYNTYLPGVQKIVDSFRMLVN